MEVSNAERVIVLVDMDCFYVQVEQKLCPEFQNKPCAVVQYKAWKGGGIIAVNYEARAKGVTRFLRGDEALKVCPDIHLFRVPEIRGKADLTRYREAGALVLDVLCEYSDCVERASIDEAYLDMTSIITSRIQTGPRVTSDQLKNTFVVGWEGEDSESRKEELEKWLQMIYEEEHLYNDRMLAIAAVIVEEMRTAVYEKTGYRCSAGIAHNKMLAKLSCGLHKPNKQTLLPQASIQLLFKTIPIKKVRNLGGKLGEAIAKKFNAEKMGDLFDIPKSQLVNQFGEKTGHWLYNLVRGIDTEPVTSRQLPKSIGCGKNFPGKQSLSTKKDVIHWLKQLAAELEERLIKDQNDNRRFARLLTVSVRINENGMFSMISRSCPIHTYNSEKLAHDALAAINKLNTSSSDLIWKPSIWTLSMAASKFEDRLDNSHCNIESYFCKGNSSLNTSFPTTASTSSENNNLDASSDSTNKFSKSIKKGTSDRSIASFFEKKQDIKIKSCEEKERSETDKDINENNTELDSFLSACNNINEIDESNEPKTEKVSFIKENVSTESKDNVNKIEEFRIKGKSACSNVDFTEINDDSRGTKIEEIPDAELQTVCPDKQGKSLDFFAKNVKEQSKISFDLKFEDETSCDDTNNYVRSDKTFDACDRTTVLNQQDKPLGFFARKLKEKSESNFVVDSETSCDSLNNEPLKNNVIEEQKKIDSNVTPSISVCDQTSCSNDISDVSCIDLDPELTTLCEKCNKRIPIWEETEHLDYHFALDVSKEFSNSHRTNNSASVIVKNVPQKSKNGRKRGSATKSSSQSKKILVKTKTIDSFFK